MPMSFPSTRGTTGDPCATARAGLLGERVNARGRWRRLLGSVGNSRQIHAGARRKRPLSRRPSRKLRREQPRRAAVIASAAKQSRSHMRAPGLLRRHSPVPRTGVLAMTGSDRLLLVRLDISHLPPSSLPIKRRKCWEPRPSGKDAGRRRQRTGKPLIWLGNPDSRTPL
jgi:hypothetical protein